MRAGIGICCPSCGSNESRVVDSRAKLATIYRRRVCACGARWATEERIVGTSYVPSVPRDEARDETRDPSRASKPLPATAEPRAGVASRDERLRLLREAVARRRAKESK